GAYLGSVANALTASADGNSRSAIKVVSRGLPSSVFTFPLRDRYLPPCLCTMSCTEAAYAGTHSSSVTLMSAITYTVIVFISCSRSKKNAWTAVRAPRAATRPQRRAPICIRAASFDHLVGTRDHR